MAKRTYLVTLVDRESLHSGGNLVEQRILVDAETPDGMQEFVDKLTNLQIANPLVASIRRLEIRRPLPRTTMSAFTA